MAETVIGLARLVLRADQQAGLDQGAFVHALAGQRALDRRMGIRGIAQAEAGDGGVVQAAAVQIIQRRLAFRHAQAAFVMARRCLDHIVQSLALFGLFALFRGVDRHLHAGLRRQPFDGVGDAQAFDLHDEVDDVAVLTAGKAVIEALFRHHGEGWSPFRLKGAQADEFAAAPDQLDVPRHHLAQVDAGAQFFQERRWKGHGRHLTPASAGKRFGRGSDSREAVVYAEWAVLDRANIGGLSPSCPQFTAAGGRLWAAAWAFGWVSRTGL